MHVLINQQSGTAVDIGPAEVAAQVANAFGNAGCEATVELLEGKEIGDRLRALAARGADAIIVGGGDGTVTTAATILRGTKTALGILPLGTFNLLARDLDIPPEIDEAAATLCRGRRREIDVAEVNGRLILCVCIAGFYPNLAARSREMHTRAWWLKACVVFWETMKAFMHYRSLTVEVGSEGGEEGRDRFRTRFVAVANNKFADLFGVVPKRSTLDDGHLAAYISEHRSRLGLLRWMLLYLVGKWEDDQDVSVRLARRITLRTRRRKKLRLMIDGELVKESTPLEFTCFPKALTVLC